MIVPVVGLMGRELPISAARRSTIGAARGRHPARTIVPVVGLAGRKLPI
jgi:hypothetical protein